MNIPQKIEKSNIQDILPLSPMQEGMLFHYINNENDGQYFEQLSLCLIGILDKNIVESSWAQVSKTNEMLRTVFRWQAIDRPIQIVLKQHTIPFTYIDLSGEKESNKQGLANRIREEDFQKSIDISKAPFRVILVKLSDDRYEMIISNHHILYDGWSNGIILKEFFQAYQGLAEHSYQQPPTKTSYKEFLRWCLKQDQKQQQNYWENYLKGFESKSTVKSNAIKTQTGNQVQKVKYQFSNQFTEAINSFCKEQKITLATFLYTVWGILLQRYTREDDVVFGTTVSGRPPQMAGIEEMVGLFINTLPLRISSSNENRVIDILRSVDAALLERAYYENTPLVDIESYSEMDRKDNLFDTVLVLENYPLDKQLANLKGDLKIGGYMMHEYVDFSLVLVVTALQELELSLHYDDSYHESEAAAILKQFATLMDSIISNPYARSFEVDLLTQNEKNRLLMEFNETRRDYPKDKTIQQLFEEQVERNPHGIAAVHQGKSLTYRELNERANQLARLLREAGVGKDVIVGLMMDRSLEMMIGIMGILKAGGAYLPIDPGYPQDRIQYMLEDSAAEVLVVQPSMKNSVRFDGKVISLDEGVFRGEAANLEPNNGSESLAYVIYTSGSTGKPKGNLTVHYNVTRVVKEAHYLQGTE